MEQQINFMAPEVQAVLPLLLADKSTGRNIIWATDPPQALSDTVTDKSEMTPAQLHQLGFEAIQARAGKQADAQQQRTRRRGEVCTPAWVCNKMINALDADWFGREGVFNTEQPQGWQAREGQVEFPASKGKAPLWQQYIDSRRLEITCGEAPFLASRYDAATGEMIPVQQRIGILDRKLRVVSETVKEEKEWLYWAKRAVQATYGYEYQGDNLLLARTNLLLTFAEHLQARWQRSSTTQELKATANIIAWNLWQMDGLKRSIPGGKLHPDTEQLNLFSMFGDAEESVPSVSCKVKNWRKGSHGTAQNFETIQEGSTSMKFDYVIGNPPYQISDGGAGVSATPIYNRFIEAIKTTHPGAMIRVGTEMIDQWKIIISRLTAEHAGQPAKDGKYRVLSTMELLKPGEICSETYLVAGAFDSKEEASNYMDYLKTQFVRFLILQIAMTQQLSKASFAFVPCQDFTRKWTDEQLFEKYDLSSEEVNYIQGMIKEMA